MRDAFRRVGLLIAACVSAACSTPVLWSIGESDGSASGLALAPDRYEEYLTEDFGWEDKFFLVGYSDPAVSFPYVLPGPADRWAGSSTWSGIRAQVANVFFDVEKKGLGPWKLVVDVVDANYNKPPVLKVTVNGQVRKFQLEPGFGDGSITGDYTKVRPAHLEIPLKPEWIHKGHNEVIFTTIEGSWTVFDAIRMEAPRGARLRSGFPGAYVREVRVADYQGETQPLLVPVDHLDGTPTLTVELDGVEIFSRPVEKGSYCLEAPMPCVSAPRTSSYTVKLDGKPVREGKVRRTPGRPAAPTDYVDTRFGTAHSRWMLAPGPWMPFSMVKIAPDNQLASWQCGYDPTIESVGQFSHIHEWTMAALGTLPVCGPLKTRVGSPSERDGHADGYRSYIDPASEVCEAGYYSVRLTDYDILAELTATDRCSFQRYTYPKGATPRVMVDLRVEAEYGVDILDCELAKVSSRRIEGRSHQISRNVYSADQEYVVHFVMEFDRDITAFGGWQDDAAWTEDSRQAEHPQYFGCYVEFAPEGETVVQVRTGLSFVDMDGATGNLKAEVETPFGWDFEAVRTYNRDTWNDLLARVEIDSDDALEKTRFYTNFYRALCSRNTFSDVDGRWSDQFRVIRTLSDPDARALGCDAFWNTFWNLNQVWNLATPEWSSRWVKSQLAMYEANGWLGKGPAGMTYIPVMVAEHEIPQMVSAYQMGIRDYDPETLFAAVRHQVMEPGKRIGSGYAGNSDLEPYLRYHYVPCDKGAFSNTMEYSFDDWTVSQLARSLGKTADERYFLDRGYWWKNAINRATGMCQMRHSDGRWEQPFNEMSTGAFWQYVEANAWQMLFFVPQDVPALAEYIGKDYFRSKLEEGFERSDPVRFNAPNDEFHAYPVEHGNQQSMHFAYLFNWVGQPWNTQKWARRVLERYYGYGVSNAWLGDEDQGQMSAWLVMTSLGLFQTDGGCNATPQYEIASPVFEKAVIHLDGRYGRGDRFVITAHDASRNNIYVQRATLNGQPWNRFRFDASELLKGGELELWMGPEPNQDWGVE